jgi:hypothetical protein
LEARAQRERSPEGGRQGRILTGWVSSRVSFVVEKYGEWAKGKRNKKEAREAKSSYITKSQEQEGCQREKAV